MRSAISPRLAINTFSNIKRTPRGQSSHRQRPVAILGIGPGLRRDDKNLTYRLLLADGGSLDQHQDSAVLDRLRIGDKNLRNAARAVGADLVHDLHRFDDQKRLALGDGIAETHKRGLPWLRRKISGANHRRLYRARMVDRSWRRGLDRRWGRYRSEEHT